MSIDYVLIIGGAGFIGLHLIQQFSIQCPDTQIHVFDIRPIPPKISRYFTFDRSQVTFHKGDITSEQDIECAILSSKCDVIIHSASPMHGMAQNSYHKINIIGTQTLLKVAKASKVKAFVYTSTAGVVYDGGDVINANETWPYPDVHMDKYNETKAVAEMAVIAANKPGEFLTVCLRPAGVFGPEDRQMIPALQAAAKLGQSKYQLGDNSNIFDWSYVGNIADAHILAAKMLVDPKESCKIGGHAFFVTNDAPAYFWTLVRSVWKGTGYIDKYYVKLSYPLALAVGYVSEGVSKLLNREPTFTPYRVKITCATRYHDNAKAKAILGYRPAVSLEQGIEYTLDWIREMEEAAQGHL